LSQVFTETLGYLASLCIPLAFLPQTIKLIKTKNTAGLSLIAYITYQIGGIMFLVFGILEGDIPMITCQAITATLTFIIIFIIVSNYFKKIPTNSYDQLKEKIKDE